FDVSPFFHVIVAVPENFRSAPLEKLWQLPATPAFSIASSVPLDTVLQVPRRAPSIVIAVFTLGPRFFGRPGLNFATPRTDPQVVPPAAAADVADTAPPATTRIVATKMPTALRRMTLPSEWPPPYGLCLPRLLHARTSAPVPKVPPRIR